MRKYLTGMPTFNKTVVLDVAFVYMLLTWCLYAYCSGSMFMLTLIAFQLLCDLF